ncbi:MAG: M20/M25/M40 family metallo-hydrolase, partial [Candidatus Brocadiia bacterium]
MADWTETNDQEVLDLVMRLMAVPGVSREEGRLADTIREILLENGVRDENIYQDDAHKRSPCGGECGNLIVNIPGTLDMPRRLLSAHMDTVSVHLGAEPVIEGDRIVSASGGGVASDDRAGVAAVLYAALRVVREELPHPPLALLFTVQEEIGSQGAHFADIDHFGRPEMCFCWDGPDVDTIGRGGRGKSYMEIEIHGERAKFFGPDQPGISTPVVFARAMSRLDAEGWLGMVDKDGRKGSSNVVIVDSSARGYETNVVMDYMLVRAEARELGSPGFDGEIARSFRKAFEDAAARTVNCRGESGRVDFTLLPERETCLVPEDAPVMREAARALEHVGLEPGNYRVGFLDIGRLIPRGYPAVNLGVGGANAHEPDNYLNIPDFL